MALPLMFSVSLSVTKTKNLDLWCIKKEKGETENAPDEKHQLK